MADHLSSLVLDEAAASLPLAPDAQAHLDGCAACRSKLDGLKADRAALKNDLAYRRTLNAVVKKRSSSFRFAAYAAPLFAAAAAFFLFVVPSSTQETRIKGQADVLLLDEAGQPVGVPKVGQKVRLAVGTGKHAFAAVYVLDLTGSQLLVPPSRLAPSARLPIGEAFEVTDGEFTLVAVFDDRSPDQKRLEGQLEEARDRKPPEALTATDLSALGDEVVVKQYQPGP